MSDGEPTQPQVVWVRRVSSPVLIVGVPVAVLLQRRRRKHESGWRSTIQTALVAVITVCLGTVRVVINDEALTVGFGPWGWPQRHFRLATVTHAAPLARTARFRAPVIPAKMDSKSALRPIGWKPWHVRYAKTVR